MINKILLRQYKILRVCVTAKDPDACREYLKESLDKTTTLHEKFKVFSAYCCERSELCRYFKTILDLTNTLKHLICADRQGDW